MRTEMTSKETLYGKNPDELAALCAAEGMPRFAARQIARWLYVRHTEEPQRMTDLSAASRETEWRPTHRLVAFTAFYNACVAT